MKGEVARGDHHRLVCVEALVVVGSASCVLAHSEHTERACVIQASAEWWLVRVTSSVFCTFLDSVHVTFLCTYYVIGVFFIYAMTRPMEVRIAGP